MHDSIRAARERGGLTQQQLADRAGLSRQLVSAVEAGRNTPSVAAAIALASALGVSVERLFAAPQPATVDVFGGSVRPRTAVRTVRVDERVVTVPAKHGIESIERWAIADAVAGDEGLEWLPDGVVDGVLLAGCDPLLGLIEQLVARSTSHRVVVAHASTGQAIASLEAGLVHGIAVHAPLGEFPQPPVPVMRWRLATWQVGLAGSDIRVAPSIAELLERRVRVVQRDGGAGSQRAFERALRAAGGEQVPGPVATGHVDAALRVVHGSGRAAVTMEAVAAAFGMSFQPLETHRAELWLDRRFVDLPAARALLEMLTASALHRRAAHLSGYDLAGCGTTVDATSGAL